MVFPLRRLSDEMDRVARWMAVPIALGFTIVVFLGVLMRYVFRAPLLNSYELARVGFVWSCFLGASICFKQGKHTRFIFLYEKLGHFGQRLLKTAIDLLSTGFFLFLIIMGIRMVQAVIGTYFPALGWPQYWLYLPLPVNAGIMFIHALSFLEEDVAELARTWTNRRVRNTE